MIRPSPEYAYLGDKSTELLRGNVIDAHAAYLSGEALGRPAQALVAVEIDYDLYPTENISRSPTRPEVKAARDRLRQEATKLILSDLNSLAPTNAEEEARKAHWLSQVDNDDPSKRLTDAEIVTYMAYRDLSRPTLRHIRGTQPREAGDTSILEWVFGKDDHQKGYYDSANAPEMRTVPCAPDQLMANYDRILEVFSSYAKQYGMTFYVDNLQISFSVREIDGRPMYNIKDPNDLDFITSAAAHMLAAIRDASPMVLPSRWYNSPTSYSAGPTRMDPIRITPDDRFEHRIPGKTKASLYVGLLGLMNGFAKAVNTNESPAEIPVAAETGPYMLFVPGEGYCADEDHFVLRALQHSTLSPDGTFALDHRFAEVYPVQIVQDLLAMYLTKGAMTDKDALEIMRTIRLDHEAGKLTVDEDAYRAWWAELSDFQRRLLGRARDFDDQLSCFRGALDRINYIGTVKTVRIPEFQDTISSETWHDAINRLVGSKALQPLLARPVVKHIAEELRTIPTSTFDSDG